MKGLINHGDLVFVDTGATEVRFDAVYAIRHDGKLWIKRIQQIPGGRLKLLSDNDKYPPITVKHNQKHEFAVLGRVVGMLRYGEV